MKVLLKLGGTLLDDAALRAGLARQLAAAAHANRMVVVHGGGKQMTHYLAERGVESRFVGGLRVTTPEVIDAVLKIFGGSVNHQLVAALTGAGARAVGLSGIDGGIAEAEQMDPALGAVGRVTRCNPELLDLLTGAGYLPVVACVAGSRAGDFYNVNADQMAVACAAGFKADRLIFLTDVEGVRDGDGAIRAQLTRRECEDLIASGAVTGGMQAKLNAAIAALRLEVPEVRIAPGAAPEIVARVIAGDPAGTRVVLEENAGA